MKRVQFIVVILLLFHFQEAFPVTPCPERETSLDQLNEFRPRGGLPNFFWKINHRREIRIGYFVGSITAAGDGWRDLSCNWLRVTFPQTIFRQTNGAIGGTGSDLGVFRIDKDILQDKPDLVFVEFAVNDGERSRESILQTMEGIVRKIWQADPLTDICFVYTVADEQCKSLIGGTVHPAVLAMEELAEHYGIPGIHMGMEVARLQQAKKLVFTADPAENADKIVFTRDHVHPLSESGHPIYASVVVKYLNQIKTDADEKPHTLPPPYTDNPWTQARMPAIYKGMAGCKLQFSFKGTALGLYDIIGPGTGMIRLRIDGEEKNVLRFDRHCSYYRLANIVLSDHLEDTVHDVEIEVSNENPDKSKILMDNHREKFNQDPSVFRHHDYYLGNLMIVGEITE